MDMTQLARRRVRDDHTEGGGTLAFLVEEGIAQMAIALTPFFRNLFIKLGDRGLVKYRYFAFYLVDADSAHSLVLSDSPGRTPRRRHGPTNEAILAVAMLLRMATQETRS